MEKKILVPCLDVIMIAFFAEKYTVKDHISNTKLDGLWVVSFCGFILKIYSFNTPH